MTSSHNHQYYLLKSLELARIRRGFCAPNPAVGSIIIDRDGKIISTGYHQAAGLPHAEIEAIKNLHSSDLENSTLYVTLEPCCHTGRTPPCTDAIIKSGIKHVVYAYRDPNPLVSGKGEDKLKAAGIRCEYIHIPEADAFYASYNHWQKTKLPFVTAKIAMTLDGKIADKNSKPINITSDAINKMTHLCRKEHDAILTSVKTIIMDDPQFNVRYENEIHTKPLYILDRNLNFPQTAKVISTAKSITLLHGKNIDSKMLHNLTQKNIRCVAINTQDHLLDLQEVLSIIGKDGIHDLWIEAGGNCFTQLIKNNLLQKALIYIAPHCVGEGKELFSPGFQHEFRNNKIRWEQVGQDVLCEITW